LACAGFWGSNDRYGGLVCDEATASLGTVDPGELSHSFLLPVGLMLPAVLHDLPGERLGIATCGP
jgi:hypothetical protein